METDEKKEEGEAKTEETKEAAPAQPDGSDAKTEEKMETSSEPKPEEKKEEKKEVKMVKKKKTVNKTVELPVSQRVNGQLSYERLQAAVRFCVFQCRSESHYFTFPADHRGEHHE